MAKLDHIAIYPAKGFPAHSLGSTFVRPDKILPQDRRFSFALRRPEDGQKKWLSKGKLLQILNTNLLSGIDLTFTPADGDQWRADLSIDGHGSSFQLPTQGHELATLMSETYGHDLTFIDGADEVAFADQKTPLISLLNLASVEDFAKQSGAPVSWQRLRGNLMVGDLPAWQENELVGQTITIGEAEFEVVEPIERCAAPGVNLQGERDLDLLPFMRLTYGHANCGLFLKALNEADIKKGDLVKVA